MKKGPEALRCWYQFDNSYQHEQIPKALAALHLYQGGDTEWVPDTGAMAHITDDTNTLSHLKPYLVSDTMMVGNGEHLPISQYWTCTYIS